MTDKTVDPGVAFEGFAFIANHEGNPIKAVQHAYNAAVKGVVNAGREAVMIQVLVRVAPKPIDFDDDTPLVGGVCDMSAGCESCQ